ncbi:MAG TPA: HAD family hydrolase [Chloroflexia bacterium]|nr:HAD family hydrolase [Chloroflexia bacterium]
MASPSDTAPIAIAAVFDVDRTLIPHTTTERIFIRYLFRHRVLGLGTLARSAAYLLRQLPHMDPMEAIRRNRVYLAGQSVERLRKHALRCYETDIRPAISAAGRAAVQEHQREGHITVLLSGSLDFLLAPLQTELGADHLICTHMEEVRGRFTGRIAGEWPYGDTKALLIRHFAEAHGVNFDASYAYADHHSDEAVLALFGHPVVINPKPNMQAIATGRQWPTRQF